jgi:hypothetical protein
MLMNSAFQFALVSALVAPVKQIIILTALLLAPLAGDWSGRSCEPSH